MTNLLEVSPQRWNLQQVLLLLILQMSSFSLGVQSEYPLPPLRLHVTTQNSTSLSISWTSPDDTNKDHYQYNVLLSKDIELVTNITRGLTNYTFTNLSPGTDYNVSVSSLFNNTKSQAAVIPTTTDPSPPLQLRVATQSSTSLSVSWTSSDDTNKDHYQYEVLLSKNMELVTNIRRGQTNYIFTNLSPGTDYNVSASSLYHERKSQATVIPATTNPSPPLQLRVTPQNSTSLSISWTSPYDTNKDHYQYNVLLSKNMELVTNIRRGQTNYTFTNLSPGTDYKVSVSSLYHERKSKAIVIPATTNPSPLLQLRVTTQTSTTLSISWTSPDHTNKDHYEYEVLLSSKNMELVTNIIRGQTNYTFTNLSPGTDYNVSVSSLYHERKSQATVIPATTNPSPPLQLRVTPQNSTSLSISWTSPDDTNKDHYEYNVLLSKDMELVTNITMEQTNYTFTNLSPGTDYNVSVSSLYHERKSEAAVIPATTTPGKLQNFTWHSTVTSITLQWEASQSGKDVFYQITYNKVRSSPIETNETSFTLTSLSPNTNYSICIASCLWISTDMCSDSYCKNISTDPTPDPTTPPPPPIGLILGLLGGAVIILIITLVLYRWRHLRNKKIKPGPSENHTFQPSMKIPYSKFEDYFQQLNANGGLGFAEQYETLKNVGKSQPRTAGQLPSNLPKNRYKDIVPYDHSSVFLSVQGNDTTSDYINANYIAGFSSQKEFIASQGPLPSTVVDFWRMVWEQEVSTIVMLAQCVEAGRPKCEQYWPDDKQPPHNYGKFIISLLREDNVEHWIVRALEVRNKHNNETRRVSHYHFRAWPYYDVPRSTSHLIDFVSVVYNDRNKMNTSRATVVHSSAGVGRTGTFLALDHAMQQIEHDNMVSVYKIVKDMRSNRCMMVQTEIQYVFLHKCVSDHLKSKRSIGDPIISQNQKV